MHSDSDFLDTRILVVDDEAPLHEILREILERNGAHVHVTESGDQAVAMWDSARLAGAPYHLVITDLSLGPGMDGHGLAKHIRSNCPTTRIVACTGSTADPVVKTPGAYGFDGCLAKPFLLQDLLTLVDSLMTSSSP